MSGNRCCTRSLQAPGTSTSSRCNSLRTRAGIISNTSPDGSRNIRKRLHLTLLETAQRILSAFPEAISASATAQMCALGVDVRTGVRVVAAEAEGYTLAGCERVQAALKVWAAGI